MTQRTNSMEQHTFNQYWWTLPMQTRMYKIQNLILILCKSFWMSNGLSWSIAKSWTISLIHKISRRKKDAHDQKRKSNTKQVLSILNYSHKTKMFFLLETWYDLISIVTFIYRSGLDRVEWSRNEINIPVDLISNRRWSMEEAKNNTDENVSYLHK